MSDKAPTGEALHVEESGKGFKAWGPANFVVAALAVFSLAGVAAVQSSTAIQNSDIIAAIAMVALLLPLCSMAESKFLQRLRRPRAQSAGK